MNNDRYKEFLENFNADLVLEGVYIPNEWHKTIKKNGKANLNASMLLSELLRMFCEAYKKNPETHGVCFFSYKSIAEKFSLTKRQITEAAKFLDDLGLINRSCKLVQVPDYGLANYVYITFNLGRIVEISCNLD